MAEYEIPSDLGDMSSEDAETAKQNLVAAVSADESHPYSNAHSPLHKHYVQHMTNLCERAAQGKLPPYEQAMRDGLSEQESKQTKRNEESRGDIETLKSLGYDVSQLPEPEQLTPAHAEALKMQRLLGEDKLDELAPLVQKSLTELKEPSEVQGLYSTFARANVDPQLKKEIAQKIVEYIYETRNNISAARKNRYGG